MNPLTSRVAPPSARPVDGSAVVTRADELEGWRVDYTHGGVEFPQSPVPAPPRSTFFQPILVFLSASRFNDFLWRAGQIGQNMRNDGRTIKVGAVDPAARVAGTTGKMGAKPAFTRVQSVKRYSTAPNYYPTTGGKP